jgi:hypothetical protein
MPQCGQVRGVGRHGGSQKGAPGKTPGGSRVWISESFSSRLPQLWLEGRKPPPDWKSGGGDKDWTNSQV